jgi:copper transport protein
VAARDPRSLALRGVATLALAAALGAAAAGTAHAHAVLVRATPVDGASLQTPPRTVRLSFNEEVVTRLSHVRVVPARGRAVEATVTRGGDASELVARLPPLRKGVYRVEWQSVSADDLHPTRGELVFGVGTARPPVPIATTPDPLPPAHDVAIRWLDFVALAVALGGLAVALRTLPAAARRGARGITPAQRRALDISVLALAAALNTGSLLLLVQASALPGRLPDSLASLLMQTSYGPRWATRQVLLAILLFGALALGSRPGMRFVRLPMGVTAVVLCGVLALTGHAAASRGDLSLATVAMAVHLLAAAVWTGGLAVAAIVLVPLLRRDPPSGRIALRCFGNLAAAAVAVLALTGIYSLGVQVASPDALLESVYGRTMLIKTALVLGVGSVALANLMLLRRPGGPTLLPRTVALEAAVAAAVLVPAAALTASAPGRGARWDPPPSYRAAPSERFTDARDLIVHTTVKPNRPGSNFVTVDLVERLRPPPGPVTGVDVTWSRPGAGPVTDRAVRERGVWRTPARSMDASGGVPLAITVHRAAVDDTTARLMWRINPSAPPARPAPGLSNRPLAPLASLIAAALAILLAAVGVGLALRGRPRVTPRGLIGASLRSTE